MVCANDAVLGDLESDLNRVAANVCQQSGVFWQIQDLWTGYQLYAANANFEIADLIDHTMLKADATVSDIKGLCGDARQWKFGAVCVNSCNIVLAQSCLENSATKPIAVVGFPLGATTSAAKAFEAQEAVALGAKEIDMVIALGALKSGEFKSVFSDIQAVVAAAGNKPVKVIIEACLLSRDEKIAACLLAKVAGAAFVKTSTGFSKAGATIEDIKLMRYVVGPDMGVKASGGINSYERAMEMIAAGASRIGTSSSIAIVSKGSSNSAY